MSGDKITVLKSGTIAATGKKAVNIFRLATIVQGMKFEMKTGMKLTSRAPSCFTIARREFGLKGNKDKLLAQMETILAEAKREVPVEVEG